jgi:hypothetical protein
MIVPNSPSTMTEKNQKKKKQHFVPKFYLRNFSSNRRTVQIFHIMSGIFHKSPLDSTCQESYFYGADGEFENFLEMLDNNHSRAIKKVIQFIPLSDYERIALLEFLLVQKTRTRLERQLVEGFGDAICDRYLKPMMQSLLKSDGLSDYEIEGYSVRIKNMDIFHKQSIVHAMDSIIGISDLVPCFIGNNSNTPFISSDNPVIFNNRIHLDNNFTAILSKGLQIHCPLNPHLYLLLYDEKFYTIDQSKPPCLSDINRLNALQLLNCNEILIVPDGSSKEYVDSLCSQYLNKKQRKKANFRTVKSDWLDERTRSDIDEFTIQNENSHLNFEFLRFNHKEYRIFKSIYKKIREENPRAVFPRDPDKVRELEKYRKMVGREETASD